MRRFVQLSFQSGARKNTYERVGRVTKKGSLPGIHPVSDLWAEAVREYVQGAGQQVGSDSRYFNHLVKDQFGNAVNRGRTDNWVIVPELSQADLNAITSAVREKMPFLLAENDVVLEETLPERGIKDTKTLANWMVDFFQSGIEVTKERESPVRSGKKLTEEVAIDGEPWQGLIAEVQTWGKSPRGVSDGSRGGSTPFPAIPQQTQAGIGADTFVIGSAALAAAIIIIGAST